VILGYVYGKDGSLSQKQELEVKVATPVGNFFGHLLFGWLADKVGRKRMCEYSSPPSQTHITHALLS